LAAAAIAAAARFVCFRLAGTGAAETGLETLNNNTSMNNMTSSKTKSQHLTTNVYIVGQFTVWLPNSPIDPRNTYYIVYFSFKIHCLVSAIQVVVGLVNQ